MHPCGTFKTGAPLPPHVAFYYMPVVPLPSPVSTGTKARFTLTEKGAGAAEDQ